MRKNYKAHKDPVPEFSAAMSLIFNRDLEIKKIQNEIQKLGIATPTIVFPKYELYANTVCVNISIIKNERFWEIDTMFTEMFSRVGYCLSQLKALVERYQGSICIDIVFYQYGTYPAIYFSNDNIQKISYLNADVSIDPY